MSRYFSEEAAAADGFSFEHRPESFQFVLLRGDTVHGHAMYQLFGDSGINFNSTVVDEPLRGTGLSSLLVRRAVGNDVVKQRSVHASCWFVAGFIERHPDALAEGAVFQG